MLLYFVHQTNGHNFADFKALVYTDNFLLNRGHSTLISLALIKEVCIS